MGPCFYFLIKMLSILKQHLQTLISRNFAQFECEIQIVYRCHRQQLSASKHRNEMATRILTCRKHCIGAFCAESDSVIFDWNFRLVLFIGIVTAFYLMAEMVLFFKTGFYLVSPARYFCSPVAKGSNIINPAKKKQIKMFGQKKKIIL